jgi:hypothetical protein
MKICVLLRDSQDVLLAQAEGDLNSIEEVRAKAKSRLTHHSPNINEEILCLEEDDKGKKIEICMSCTNWKLLGNHTICKDCKEKFKNENKDLSKNSM